MHTTEALDQLKAWVAFGVAQTDRLDQANARGSDMLAIIARCEARDSAAVRRARRRLLF